MGTEKFTKEDPGTTYEMLSYLSEITGISRRKEIEVNSLDKLRRKTGSRTKNKTVLIYPACDIEVIINGERIPYMLTHNIRFDAEYKEVPEKFIVTVDRPVSDFGVEIKHAGTYKNCLGGGWHENTNLLRINDKYFY